MSLRFKWQTAISQSALVDETHHSFDRQFYPALENQVLSVNSVSPYGSVRAHMHDEQIKLKADNRLSRFAKESISSAVLPHARATEIATGLCSSLDRETHLFL